MFSKLIGVSKGQKFCTHIEKIEDRRRRIGIMSVELPTELQLHFLLEMIPWGVKGSTWEEKRVLLMLLTTEDEYQIWHL